MMTMLHNEIYKEYVNNDIDFIILLPVIEKYYFEYIFLSKIR